MNKDTQKKIIRLMEELNLLNQGELVLKEAAQELGVSLRTIQRDIALLISAGFALYDVSPGVYAFIDGYSLEKMHLSREEASLMACLGEIVQNLGSNFEEPFQALKMRLLNTTEENPFFIKFAKGLQLPSTPLIQEITACIHAKEKIKICYSGGKRACYCVRPLKILWVEGFWYLLALADDDTLFKFRLEKITTATPLGTFFKYNTDIEKLIHEGTNIWFEAKRSLQVKLKVSAAAAGYFKARSYFPLQKQEKELPDGSLILSCQAVREEEIIPTVLNWIPEIKILEPKTLAEKLKKRISQYVKSL